MVISLCGECGDNKKYFIDELKRHYSNKLIVCNLWYIKFRMVVDNERVKYELFDSCNTLTKAREAFSKYIDNKVDAEIGEIINNNKDKIILFTTNYDIPELMVDIDKTKYFDLSDLKILIESSNEEDEVYYDEEMFDYVFKNKEEINIKKLVKLL